MTTSAPTPQYAEDTISFARATPPTDGLAIAAFVCALCGLGLIPVVLGHVSLNRIKRDGLGGQGFAIVGLILGYVTVAAWIVATIILASTLIWAVNA